MSNIGFIESCAKNIQDIFNAAITPPPTEDGKRGRCRAISEREKQNYIIIVREIEEMKKHNEIEDMDRFNKAYKTIIRCNLLNIPEIRKKLAKQAKLHRSKCPLRRMKVRGKM